jgi:hypothetical protein
MRHLLLSLGGIGLVAGCGTRANVPADTLGGLFDAGAGDDTGTGTGGPGGPGGPVPPNGGGIVIGDASIGGTASAQPQTCDQATQEHSYIGCDYWPTIVANNVWSIFDFAVVVANAGQSPANVTVTGPANTNKTATVLPGQLGKIYLPWVPELKGPDADNCGSAMPLATSLVAPRGAFHLVSSVPVTVYQFNALEYVGQRGPPGKNWSSCPGNTNCTDPAVVSTPKALGCFSFSNDASLLIPSTAMTGNYRVAGHEGVVLLDPGTGQTFASGAYMAITGTQDATTVHIKVSNTGQIGAGAGVAATAAGGMLTLTLNAGDVAELLDPAGGDLSGSIVQASAHVQVITGHPCIQLPPSAQACDHIEESVFPAETMGKHYVVTQPAGPNGNAVAHQVRFYGNFDGTHLTYNPSVPLGCPTVLNAGQVVECGSPCPASIDLACGASPTAPGCAQTYTCGTIAQDFEVKGDQPFSVGTFTLGATVVDLPAMTNGDPAQSFAIAVEQFRSKYVFLAPDDYTVSYVAIVTKPGTAITLDGQTVTSVPQAVGSSGYSVYRLKLGAGQAGAHVLSSSQAVGIQVVGYGSYTSYMYPGGLDLVQIAPPPLLR